MPSAAEQAGDDAAVRTRAQRITRRHTDAIVDEVTELAELGLVRSATAEVRVHGTAALFKLYIINGEQAFFGFYPVIKHTVTIDKTPVPIYDVLGKDVPLFPYSIGDEDDAGSQYVQQARGWFDSVWNTIAREYRP